VNLKKLDAFHKTKAGYLVFGLVELALAYLFFRLAANSGSLWEWALALLFFIGVLQNFGRLVAQLAARKKKKANQWP
jgi:hypothetical protein